MDLSPTAIAEWLIAGTAAVGVIWENVRIVRRRPKVTEGDDLAIVHQRALAASQSPQIASGWSPAFSPDPRSQSDEDWREVMRQAYEILRPYGETEDLKVVCPAIYAEPPKPPELPYDVEWIDADEARSPTGPVVVSEYETALKTLRQRNRVKRKPNRVAAMGQCQKCGAIVPGNQEHVCTRNHSYVDPAWSRPAWSYHQVMMSEGTGGALNDYPGDAGRD